MKKNWPLALKFNKLIVDFQYVTGIGVTFGSPSEYFFEFEGTTHDKNIIAKECESVDKDTIFDLSSISKFFTLIIVLKCVELGYFSLNTELGNLDNRFVNLKDITVDELLSYQKEIKTKKRLEGCLSITEVENLLFTATYENKIGIYSDLPAMIVRIIVEKVVGIDFYELIEEWIFKPCTMHDTYLKIPKDKINQTMSNNFERRIINGKMVVFDDIDTGVCNDGKARIFNGEKFAGHAGLFSSVDDMRKLCIHFLEGNLLNKESMDLLRHNKTGHRLPDGNYTRYFGYLCYKKHPIRELSEVHPALSDSAFAFGGYTGNQLTIDVEKKLFVFMASNRCHNTVTQIIPLDDIEKYVLVSNDKESVKYDGFEFPFTKNYVYKRDSYIMDPIILFLTRQVK